MVRPVDVPCAACRLWNQDAKSFSCDPNKCEKLSRWLLNHARDGVGSVREPVQYVV